MNKKNLEKIVADLDDLKNLIEFFSTQEKIPAIEIDIVKKKLQDIYLLFSNQQDNSVLPAKEITENPSVELEEKKKEDTPQQEPNFEIGQEPNDEKPEEPVQQTSDKTITDSSKQVTKTPEPKASVTKATLSDKLKGNNVSLNERLSGSKKNDISSRLQKGPIKDLNEAIGLNDKFSYIKTLFGGDAHRFREAIDQLNSAQDLSQAESYISANFTWNINDPATQQFLDLVHRKLQQ